jgi:hypothetical protein
VTRAPKQAETSPITLKQILGSRAFADGVRDVREGRPTQFDGKYANNWEYERGRQWGAAAPMGMPLRVGRKLNPAALKILADGFNRGEII